MSIKEEHNHPIAEGGPGGRLKAAREAQGLQLEKVADELHLKEATLIALEKNDYEQLPQPVFIKGYVRKYARLLGLDSDVMIEAFVAASPASECNRPLKHSYNIRAEVTSGHGGIKAITWFVVVGFIVLMLLFWYDEIVQQFNLQMSDTMVEIEDGDLSLNYAVDSIEEKSDSLALPVMLDEASATSDQTLIKPTEEPINSPAEEGGALDSAEPASTDIIAIVSNEEVESVVALETAQEPETVAVQVNETPADIQGVVLHFSQDAWVRVRDSANSFRRTGIQKEGEALSVRGEAPWQVKLGNAAAVRIEIDGQVYSDWQQHIDGRNVAEFSLNP